MVDAALATGLGRPDVASNMTAIMATGGLAIMVVLGHRITTTPNPPGSIRITLPRHHTPPRRYLPARAAAVVVVGILVVDARANGRIRSYFRC